MGSISCDGRVVEFDDPLLAHLQVVMVQKFRAGEPFLLSWLDALDEGDGRSSIWLTPHAVVHFKFAGSRAPAIDREWLELLSQSASSGSGLIVVNAKGELQRAAGQPRTAGLRGAGKPH
ncbi:ATP-dependent DNA ligase [uncultured Amnibacterium sp.]|uniref:DUF7882 family protein n=1 Tax=uncultured Amnibacterium sp. TaxID=1631851 RepID=UPI0035CB8E3E